MTPRQGRGEMKGGSAPPGLGGEQVEGHHAVHELLSAGRRRAQRLLVTANHRDVPAIALILELAQASHVPVQFKGDEALRAAAQTGAPQGVIAWADPVRPTSLEEVLEGRGASPVFVLVLDGVTDPGNFGAVLRTAACAGADAVVIARHRASPLTAGAVKAAAGAVEHLPIAQVAGVPAALARLSQAGVWTVGLDPSGPVGLWQAAVMDGPVALVLGSEGRGLSQLTRQRCDVLARIPQVGPLGSLNVAAAAAVACFEVPRRRAAAITAPT